ncbi:hypothetical protein FRC01_011131, partial [Tulasnella sp. 417]
GSVALVLWVAIIAYAILNCVINPIGQFAPPKGLPSKLLLQDRHEMTKYGNITGFIDGFQALGVAPIYQFPPETDSVRWSYTLEEFVAIFRGIRATFTDPLIGEVKTDTMDSADKCLVWADGHEIERDEGPNDLQIEAWWDCGPIWDRIEFRTSASVPDTRPYVSVSWNSSAYQTSQVLNAGLGSIHFGRSNIMDSVNMITGRSDNPNEVKPGVTFNLTAGQDLRINVGRRRDYNVRGTFLDLIGIPQTPSVDVTYPIHSPTQSSASIDPNITTLNFYPEFSASTDELYEQYLENTVISGLTKTGGLLSSFDVVFILLFGRSLVAALFGRNNMSPFGAIASIIQREKFRKRLQAAYPGIDGENPSLRAEATCNFLHDFLLDLKPLEIRPRYKANRSTDSVEEGGAGSDVTGGEKEIEAAEGTPSTRLRYGGGGTDGSEKV